MVGVDGLSSRGRSEVAGYGMKIGTPRGSDWPVAKAAIVSSDASDGLPAGIAGRALFHASFKLVACGFSPLRRMSPIR